MPQALRVATVRAIATAIERRALWCDTLEVSEAMKLVERLSSWLESRAKHRLAGEFIHIAEAAALTETIHFEAPLGEDEWTALALCESTSWPAFSRDWAFTTDHADNDVTPE